MLPPSPGKTGQHLEQLYEAYFAIQRSLAADELPAAEDAKALLRASLTTGQRRCAVAKPPATTCGSSPNTASIFIIWTSPRRDWKRFAPSAMRSSN